MSQKKEKLSKTLEVIFEKMTEMDLEDSFGLILLKTGMILKVDSFFQVMLEQWSDYKMAVATANKEKLDEVMKETGGVLSNKDITVDVDAVIGMIAAYRNEDVSEVPLDDIRNFLEGGDSFLPPRS
jgi:hypothetical protein